MTPEEEYAKVCSLVSEFDDVAVFDGRTMGLTYCTALIGVTTSGQAVYDYEKMVRYLEDRGMAWEDVSAWIDDAICAVGHEGTPLIMFPIYGADEVIE